MQIGICSFSFHRLLNAGKQDIFQLITDCKKLGCTQLDPWNAHLSELKGEDAAMFVGKNPSKAQLSGADNDFIDKVRAAADKAELPVGTIAVDGAHLYADTAEERAKLRGRAYRWLEIAARLGAKQARVDAGGTDKLPQEQFDTIVDGYKDLVQRGGEKGIEILTENHWGSTTLPDNVSKMCDAVKGLGLLFDTYNWSASHRGKAWYQCAKYARATHVKTFAFDENGDEITENIPRVVKILKDAGYNGAWGIESVPGDGEEIAGARKTIALLHRLVG